MDELKAISNCNNIILVGNKSDLCLKDSDSRKITIKQAEEFADKHKLMYAETNAFDFNDVNRTFKALLERICFESLKDNKDSNDRKENEEAQSICKGNYFLYFIAVVIVIILIIYQAI